MFCSYSAIHNFLRLRRGEKGIEEDIASFIENNKNLNFIERANLRYAQNPSNRGLIKLLNILIFIMSIIGIVVSINAIINTEVKTKTTIEAEK